MLVNAADYGVPQIRFRVFVVAFRRDLGLQGLAVPGADPLEAALLARPGTGGILEAAQATARPEPRPVSRRMPGG